MSVNLQASTSKRIPPLQNAINNSKIQRGSKIYSKSGLAHTLHGNIYQLKLLMLFLKRGLNLGYSFQLATEWDEAEKLDDLVFRYETSQGFFVRFLQAKHKQDEDKKIKVSDLLNESDGEFSLLKYFMSHRKIRNNDHFKNITIEDLVIATNIDLHDDLKNSFEVITTPDKLLGIPNETKCYKFTTGGLLMKDDITSILESSSDLHLLAIKLGKFIMEGKQVNLREEIFNRYKYPLSRSVINCDNASFHPTFFGSIDARVAAFRILLEKEFDKKQQTFKFNASQNINVSKTFAPKDSNFQGTKDLPNDYIKQLEIDEFLKKLKIVVTPNEMLLTEMIKKELLTEFNQIDTQAVSSRFLEMMLNWFKEKQGTFLTNHDAKEFFETIRKEILGPICFAVRSPIQLFTGRTKELEELHEKVLRNGMGTVISQMTFLSGLGGIGKSELAKKYAEVHSKHFDFNVIWINAESRGSLEKSFVELAEFPKINISLKTGDGDTKSIESIVHEVYSFFSRRKVLFIFDNAENCAYFHNFLPLDSATLSPGSQKPFILITSREKRWDSQIEVLELHEMKIEDAVDLIKKGLKISNASQDEDVKALALVLQCFPLALHQAIAYIRDKKATERPDYEIEEYLNEFSNQTSTLLEDESFIGIDNNYTKTTYTTWQMTIEKLERSVHPKPGNLAVKILNIIGYLSPELIKKSIFTRLGGDREVNLAISMLINHCMVNCDNNPNIIHVHRLVQEVTRLKLKRSNEVSMLKETLTLVNDLEVKLGSDHYRYIWKYAAMHKDLIEEFYLIPCGYDEYSPLHLLSSNIENNTIIQNMLRFLSELKLPEGSDFETVLNAKDVKKRTPLHVVAESNNLFMLKLFINHGAKLDTADSNGSTPLLLAASKGNVRVLDYLLKRGASTEIIDIDGNNPAMLAALAGHVKAVELLLKGSASLQNYQLQAMINNAAKQTTDKQDKLCQLRLFISNLQANNENDVLSSRIGNWSPVERMVENGYDTSFIETMIDNVAVLETSKIDRITYLAAINSHLYILEFLESKGYTNIGHNVDGYTSLHVATLRGNLEIVKYFVEKRKAPVNITDKKNDTPLHSAAFHGRTEIVEYLLKNGAAINAINRWGFTPILSAATAGKFDTVKFLLNQDVVKIKAEIEAVAVDPNRITIAGRVNITLLHIVAVHDAVDVAKILIEKDMIDVDIGAEDSLTPLHVASFSNSKKTIDYLIKMDANVDAQANVFEGLDAFKKDKTLFEAIPWLKKMLGFDTRDNRLLKFVTSLIKPTPVDLTHALGHKNKLTERPISFLAGAIKRVLPSKPVEFLKLCIDERDNERFEKSEVFSHFEFYESHLYSDSEEDDNIRN